MILISGTPGSGKSQYAEQLFCDVSDMEKYYIATMVPYGEEGLARVRKHRKMREGKGFITIECATNVSDIVRSHNMKKPCACLLECISNLAGNEIYDDSHRDWDDRSIADYIADSVMKLDGYADYLVVVTNSFDPSDGNYDEETKRYIRINDYVNELLINKADEIHRISDGSWTVERRQSSSSDK